MRVEPDVLLVGGGSRAILVLERLARLARLNPDQSFSVCVVEPGPLGPGVHQTDQPDYIRFNTDRTCPTLFAKDDLLHRPYVEGPSFSDWLSDQPLHQQDVVPSRGVVGQYLAWVAERVRGGLPNNLVLTHLKESVAGADVVPGGVAYKTTTGRRIEPRATILAIGHAFASDLADGVDPRDPVRSRIVVDVFPLRRTLGNVQQGDEVAVRGMGLTALDIVTELTIGRGGYFVHSCGGDKKRYIPGGREPIIYLSSRSGCPVRARPDLPAGIERPSLAFLTRGYRDRLADLGRPLCFETDVFPLILAELARRISLSSRSLGAQSPIEVDSLVVADDAGLEAVRDRFNSVEAMRLRAQLRPAIRGSVAASTVAAARFIQADVTEARRGAGSPLKLGLEVLLEARVFVKSLVDYGTCAFTDLDWLYGEFTAIVNRNVIGPDIAKSLELLALIEAGVVKTTPAGTEFNVQGPHPAMQLPGSRRPIAVDWLVAADRPTSTNAAQREFVSSLISSGLAIPVLGAGARPVGLKVDHELRLASRAAGGPPAIWATGPICEGSSYYNNYIPCIQADAAYPFRETDRLVDSIAAALWSA